MAIVHKFVLSKTVVLERFIEIETGDDYNRNELNSLLWEQVNQSHDEVKIGEVSKCRGVVEDCIDNTLPDWTVDEERYETESK